MGIYWENSRKIHFNFSPYSNINNTQYKPPRIEDSCRKLNFPNEAAMKFLRLSVIWCNKLLLFFSVLMNFLLEQTILNSTANTCYEGHLVFLILRNFHIQNWTSHLASFLFKLITALWAAVLLRCVQRKTNQTIRYKLL